MSRKRRVRDSLAVFFLGLGIYIFLSSSEIFTRTKNPRIKSLFYFIGFKSYVLGVFIFNTLRFGF